MATSVGSSDDGRVAWRGLGQALLPEPGAEPPDSAEARELAELQRTRREHVIEVLAETLNGTRFWNFFVRASWVLSHLTLVYGIFVMPELAIERKGFRSMGMAYSTSSTMTLTKFIRDREEALKIGAAVKNNVLPSIGSSGTIAALNGTCEWLVAYGGAWLPSVSVTLGGTLMMPLEVHQRLFLILSFFSCISTTITLPKQVRDQEDSLKWRALGCRLGAACVAGLDEMRSCV